jgi:tRNA(Ile)-lysidine synthase
MMTVLDDLQGRVARCFARYENLPAAPAVLAAVSGGVDSTVLAVVLARLARNGRLPGPLIVAHVDHRQHARSGDAVAHVARLAHDLGAGFVHRTLEGVPQHASEDTLRTLRYAALEEMARACDAGFIVTAHHADDDAETVLFRMLRGTGLRGLAGIPEHRVLAPRLHLLRPLLEVRRATLVEIAKHEGLAVFDDPSNVDTRYTRNALRHELMPALRAKAGASNLDASLFALVRTARAAADVLDAQARRLLSERSRQPLPWRAEFDLQDLVAHDRPFVREALAELDARLRAPAAPSPAAVLDRVLDELWEARCGQRVTGLGADTLLYERTKQGLLLVHTARAGTPFAGEVLLPLAGSVQFGTSGWTLHASVHGEPPLEPSPTAAGPLRALLDLSAAPAPWHLRTRRTGDRFTPLGLSHDVALRRFMQSRHVPRFDRDRLPILVGGDETVLWVPGTEIAARAAISPGTAACVEVVASLQTVAWPHDR